MDEKVSQHFAGYFQLEIYAGEYGSAGGHQPANARQAGHDFDRLTDNQLIWTQAHGDFKSVAARATFQPYQHWAELYQACKDCLREHGPGKLETFYYGPATNAQIMGDVMELMRRRHGLNCPKWWLAIMKKLRGQTPLKIKA
jgi:hypothetical protein